MSILGMTDRGEAFPQIGAIRKGAPKSANAPGKDLQYFRVTFDEQEQDAAVKFRATFGDQPTEVTVLLPFDDLERTWSAHLEAYLAGGLVYRGNGDRATFWIDPGTGEVKVKDGNPITPCVGIGGRVGQFKKESGKIEQVIAKPVGRLKVIVPALGRFAYLVVNTTSKWDIMHIDEQLKALRVVNGGRLAGIPLILRRRPKMVSTPINGKRVRVEKWLISIEASAAWVQAQVEALNAYALPQRPEVPQLAAGQAVVEQRPTSGIDLNVRAGAPDWTDDDPDDESEDDGAGDGQTTTTDSGPADSQEEQYFGPRRPAAPQAREDHVPQDHVSQEPHLSFAAAMGIWARETGRPSDDLKPLVKAYAEHNKFSGYSPKRDSDYVRALIAQNSAARANAQKEQVLNV